MLWQVADRVAVLADGKVQGVGSMTEESVAGLNLNAPVKYNGVEVGKVSDIRLDPVNPEKVRLTFAIEHGTPIKADTVAVLKTQGLTIGAVPPFPYLNDFASAHPASVTAVIWLPKRQSALQI